VHALGDLRQELLSDLRIGGVFGEVDGYQQLLSLRIDIANVDSSLVGEEDPVAL
jgi:hypothetical protein